MTAPWAFDLCAGWGGVATGMMAGGFRVLGVDVVARKGYPAPLLLHDVRTLQADVLPRSPAWVHGSPPCQRFSRARSTRKVDPPTDADCDVLRAILDLKDDLAPAFWTIENVSGAVLFFEPYIGRPKFQHGPFYLWGNFPAFLVERTGLSKHMAHPDPARGLYGHNCAADRNRTPPEITTPLAKAIMAAVRPSSPVGNLGGA
jgi:hypothetical protein